MDNKEKKMLKMNNSLSAEELLQHKKGQILRSVELEKLLGSRTAVRRALKNGKLQQVARGIYSVGPSAGPGTDKFIVLRKYYSESIISGVSAMAIHGLLKIETNKLELDVPREANPPRKHELFNFNRKAHTEGSEIKLIKGQEVLIYSKERCLFEAWSLFGKMDGSYNEVLANYCLGQIKKDEIDRLGKRLRGKEDILSTIHTFMHLKGVK